ncbi:MAG: MoaD/ThiS family protein [Dehalococcoidia bacterium]|jgi:molybdopterin converting factor small subunit|nr:MoaD/ThiS family protein [Dehalococcoidia bacterium]|tara:strand:- start:432 stop:695 length:264 start_codon:yes stop_codon:yes gene_type:complete
MAIVIIPTMLRKKCTGEQQVEVSGETLRLIINELENHCPGISLILIHESLINPSIQIAINGIATTTGLSTKVPKDAEINIIPAIAGG